MSRNAPIHGNPFGHLPSATFLRPAVEMQENLVLPTMVIRAVEVVFPTRKAKIALVFLESIFTLSENISIDTITRVSPGAERNPVLSATGR